MKLRIVFAVLCATAVVVAASPVRAKDDLVIGVAQFPSSLHPNIDPEVIKAYTLGFALRPVTAFDKDWKNSCLLCAELPSLGNGLVKLEDHDGQQGMAVTIKLKPDLFWGDGVRVTAKDIAFTWQVGRDANSGFSNPDDWTRVSAVDVLDEQTAVLHLSQVSSRFDRWDELLPEHIERTVYEKAGGAGDYLKQTTYNRAPTTAGLYNGPYMITGYESGAQIVLEPNPHWAGTKPGFRRIIIKYIGNTAALQANLLSGDVDMVAGEGVGLTIDQVLALRKQQSDRFIYIFKPSLTYEHIDLNLDNPLLGDLRVRQALLLSIDRKTLVDKLFEGMQPVAATWVNPLEEFYNSGVEIYAFDPSKAHLLLTEAGFTPDADGICRDAAGQKLSFEFSTTAGNRLRELTQQVLQSQWKAACVEVMIKNEPARTFFGETVKKRQFTGMAMYAWSSTPSLAPRQMLATDSIPTAANNFGGSNYVGFSHPLMDADIEMAETELDTAKQRSLWSDMQRIYADKLPVLPLFFRAEAHVVPLWLKGYVPTGQSNPGTLWAENWRPG